MKKWKKYVSLLLALLMCLSMTACGGNNGSGDVTPNSAPDVLEDLVFEYLSEYDYGAYLGTWEDGQGNVLFVEDYGGGWVYYELLDVNGDQSAYGSLQYVEAFDSVYAHNEFDGAAYRLWFDANELVFEYFGSYIKVSGDVPGETIGDIEPVVESVEEIDEEDEKDKRDEVDEVPDISGFTGFWRVENEPFYFVIGDDFEWAAVNFYGEQIGPGYIVAEGDSVTLCKEDGSEVVTLRRQSNYELIGGNGCILTAVNDMMLLPTPQDQLSETAYFSDSFSNVSIRYPAQMEAHAHSRVSNSVSLNAILEDGTDDYYTNIVLAFQSISGYDSHMEKGAAIAESYMLKMLDDFITSMCGDKVIKFIGSDFQDNGDYYSITGYMWLKDSYFSGGSLSRPVRGCMEVRYYGPTGYALVALTAGVENRVQNYIDICSNILETISYRTGWSTAPKSRPAQPAYSGDSAYYWYDTDGDIWYWNGYENVFICFGTDGCIDNNGRFIEFYEPGWDYEYYDDYDPWSDPGDGWTSWSDPGDTEDGWGDFF